MSELVDDVSIIEEPQETLSMNPKKFVHCEHNYAVCGYDQCIFGA